jgi:AcrR family transcriptional regulator
MARTFPSSVAGKKAVLPLTTGGEGPRRRILEVALQLFASRGFHASSTRDLARALELQPSALYAHFASKEHVLADLVRIGHEVHLEKIRSALLGAGNDPADQMSALVRAHARMHATFPHLTIVINEEMFCLPAELAAPGVALRGQSTALILEVIERGVELGRFSAPHPMTAAAAIGAIGLRIPYWFESGPDLDVERLADLQADLALRMLGVDSRR